MFTVFLIKVIYKKSLESGKNATKSNRISSRSKERNFEGWNSLEETGNLRRSAGQGQVTQVLPQKKVFD